MYDKSKKAQIVTSNAIMGTIVEHPKEQTYKKADNVQDVAIPLEKLTSLQRFPGFDYGRVCISKRMRIREDSGTFLIDMNFEPAEFTFKSVKLTTQIISLLLGISLKEGHASEPLILLFYDYGSYA